MSTQIKESVTRIMPVIAAAATVILLFLLQSATAYAAPQHGIPDTENDYHTAAWDRFNFNYQFQSGSDHRFELGRPTSFSGIVPVDVSSVNMRRDANVSLRPPQYGVFSGHIPTAPTSRFFPQPANPNFNQVFVFDNQNLDPRFDTARQGVNAQTIGNPINIQNVGAGEFLPPTSIR